MTLLERQCWAALISVPGIGHSTFKRLRQSTAQRGYSLVDFWYHWPNLVAELQLKPKQQGGLRVFQRQFSLESYWQSLCDKNIIVITDQDEGYPHLLARCEDRPAVLFIKGQYQFWNQAPIAVVGTRRITSYGQLVTEKITRELVQGGGATVVSGFMYGVDVLAHQTTLREKGHTIGVLGFGFDYLYPRHHQQLVDELLAQGSCLITELQPATPPSSGTFPIRNRIIAGLSLAVVVTEAAEQSGSHITASHAVEYGRLVAAVPGPITNHFSEGTKNLIKQGAVLISSGYELLAELQLPYHRIAQTSAAVKNKTEALVVAYVSSHPTTIDELIAQSGLSAAEIMTAVTILELNQEIKRVGDRWTVV